MSIPAGTQLDVNQVLLAFGVMLPFLIGGLAYLLRLERKRIKTHYEERASSLETSLEQDAQRARAEAIDGVDESDTVQALRRQVAELARERDDTRTNNPRFRRLTFSIGVIGIGGSGKTALCLRLTDPLFRDLSGTVSSSHAIDYDRSVVIVNNKRDASRCEYVFRFREWGGERLIEAQSDMLRHCEPARPSDGEGASMARGMQALILVVDLAEPRTQVLSRERIRVQIETYFDARSLRFLLNQNIQTHLQTVVLFINKADVIAGPVEAKALYRELSDSLAGLFGKLHVIVGSVQTDAGLLGLYSHLVEAILPAEVKRQRPLGRGLDPDVRGLEPLGDEQAAVRMPSSQPPGGRVKRLDECN